MAVSSTVRRRGGWARRWARCWARRWARAGLRGCAVGLLVPFLAAAQSPADSAEGSPATASAPATTAPRGGTTGEEAAGAPQSGPENAAADKPAPHPSANPHHGAGFVPPPTNVSRADASLPPGTIDLEVLDGSGQPVPNLPVELHVTHESIAEGTQDTTVRRTTDGQGKVRFDSLSRELRYSYALVAEYEGGRYGIPAFRLDENRGQQVRLHVFRTTPSPIEAFVGMRGFVYFQPREDVFHVEMLFRVLNMGTMAWLPQDVILQLPERFQAFDSPREGLTRIVEEPGRGARLAGTFAPGQHDVRLTFQVPSAGKGSQRFVMTLPPNLAELRVISEAAPGMSLEVDGFGPAETARGPSGDRVLITGRTARPGERPLDVVRVRLDGLPVQGPARWVVTLLASLIAASGLYAALRRRGRSRSRDVVADADLKRAEHLLLDELVQVERAFEAGELGPRTRDQARRQLLDALARLDLVARPPATGA